MLSESDLDLLTDQELYETAVYLNTAYRGRDNTIDDIKRRVGSFSRDKLPRFLRNLKVARDKGFAVPNRYDILALMSMSDVNTSTFAKYFDISDESLADARCDIIKILTYSNKLLESDIIIAMHPNFGQICHSMTGPDFVTKLRKMAAAQAISEFGPSGEEKPLKVIFLELLKRLPEVDPVDISWNDLLNRALSSPELLYNSYKYFGKWGVENQLYILTQMVVKDIQPAGTAIDWKKLGANIKSNEIPLFLAVPDENNYIYSPSIFLYQQTTLSEVRINLLTANFDITKLGYPTLDRKTLAKIVLEKISSRYQGYWPVVVDIIMFSLGIFDNASDVNVPDSDVAVGVIRTATEILRIGKVYTITSYPETT